MRRGLALLAVTGCTKLFGLQHIDQGTGDGGLDAVIDGPKVNICLTDDFSESSINTSTYTVGQAAGGTTAITNGGVLITWPANMSISNYGDVDTANAYDLRGGDVSVDIVAFTGDTADGELDVILDPAHVCTITVGLNAVEFDLYDGDPLSYSIIGQMTYSALPLTLRFSHDLATDMVTYSVTDSGGTTFPMTIAKPFTVQNVEVGFSGGSYGPAMAVGHAKFDNLVVRSPFCL